MKICFLTTSYPRFEGDDAGVFVKRLVESLADKATKISVVVPHDKTEPILEQNKNVEINRFRYKPRSLRGVAFGAGIIPNIKSAPWLVLYLPVMTVIMFFATLRRIKDTNILVANWLLSAVVAMFVRIVTTKPYIYIVRGVEVKILKKWLGRHIFYFVIRFSKKTVCVSEDFCNLLKTNFPQLSHKIAYIPNGITYFEPTHDQLLNFTHTKENQFSRRRKLIFIGTIIPRKNILWLIELMSFPEMQDFQLILCGRLDDRKYVDSLKELIERTDLVERVTLVGEVLPHEVPLYLMISDIYISASTYEGTPNSILEALALGKIVFASDIEAHKRIVQNEYNGFLFGLNDHNAAVNKIKEVLNDPILSTRISKNASESVKNRTWQYCAEQYLQMING